MARKICLLMGPGTLASQGVDRMDMLRYAQWVSGKPLMTGQQLLAALPEINAIADVKVDGGNPYSIANLDDLCVLARRINDILRNDEADSVVFVQGTNSIEETAYFLHLTIRSKKPVIVTGAQRPFTALSTDGPLNLIDAMRVATSDDARGMGALVVTNGEINTARDITKTSTYRLQTFKSRDLGVLGYADADGVVFYRRPFRGGAEFDISSVKEMPRVDILYVHTGMHGDLARAAVDLGARGLVIAGSGAGSTAELRKPLAELAAHGTLVVRSARVGEGRVIRNDNWQEPGMVAADNLSPQKAAILLSLALTMTRDPDTIQKMFDSY
ncbi:MAG: asparaginase [Xanthobacteraceae bacterium]